MRKPAPTNWKKISLIVGAAILIQALGFWAVSGIRPLPKVARIDPPNFFIAEEHYVDKESGETRVHREFTVSTKLATPTGPTEAPTPQDSNHP